MRIIVAREKHETRHLDASTDEKWAESSLKLLTERFNDGYWYHDPVNSPDPHPFSVGLREKRDALLALDEAQVAALPDSVQRAYKDAQDDIAWEQEASAFYQRVKEVVEAQDLSFVNGEPKAWALLEVRRDAEYEDVSLEDLE